MGVVFGSAFCGRLQRKVLSLKDWLSGKVVFMNILETRNLKKYYGSEGSLTKALDGVNLSQWSVPAAAVNRLCCICAAVWIQRQKVK